MFTSDFEAIERGSMFKNKDINQSSINLTINLVAPWSSEKGIRFVAIEGVSVGNEEFEVSAVLFEGTRLAVASDPSAVTVLLGGLEEASKAGNVSPSLRARLHSILACVYNSLLQHSDAVHHFEAAHT